MTEKKELKKLSKKKFRDLAKAMGKASGIVRNNAFGKIHDLSTKNIMEE